MADGFLKDFTTHYMDPTEVYGRFHELADEFPNISELITLPNKTNGYQRKAQANMSGALAIGDAPSGATAQGQTVVLTTRAWGHEGGNDITAEFMNPGIANAPLTVTMTGNDLLVSLGTDATGARRARPRRWSRRSTPARGARAARLRGELPRQRGRRHRAAAREGQPVRLPRDPNGRSTARSSTR